MGEGEPSLHHGDDHAPAGRRPATSVPLCSTMMRSASSRTTSILCSTSRMVRSWGSFSLRIRFRRSRAPRRRVHAGGGVHRTRTRWTPAPSAAPPRACAGRRAAGLATVACCRSVMETVQGTAPAVRQVRHGRSRHLRGSGHLWCRPSRVACTARRTFSSTVRLGNRLVSWKAPRPARVRADGDSADRSRPSSDTVRWWPLSWRRSG